MRHKETFDNIVIQTGHPIMTSVPLTITSASLYIWLAQSVGAVEYTDCISAKELDSPKECPSYGIKQSDGDTPVILEVWELWSTPLLP